MHITDNWYYPLVRYCSYIYSITLPEKSCWLSIHMCSMQFEDFENAMYIFYHVTITPHLPPVLQTHSPLCYLPFDAHINPFHLWYFSPECGPCCDAWLTVAEHKVLCWGKDCLSPSHVGLRLSLWVLVLPENSYSVEGISCTCGANAYKSSFSPHTPSWPAAAWLFSCPRAQTNICSFFTGIASSDMMPSYANV